MKKWGLLKKDSASELSFWIGGNVVMIILVVITYAEGTISWNKAIFYGVALILIMSIDMAKMENLKSKK
ncbi:hypothetical protein KZX50_00685 [Bacillus infantis]|uniref:hypothetical protein n=1 Tax=Bacillus infantis TaxID=324767 RepID=UPI002003ECD5|nr:hypothetical protein [Bacillus infantis]MCK6203964.1 hypothetical protein [Bacillus infantis]